MKKRRSLWLCLLLTAILSIGLLMGCGKGNGKPQENSSAQQSAVVQTQEQQEAEQGSGQGSAQSGEELVLYDDEDLSDDVYAEDEETVYEEETGKEQEAASPGSEPASTAKTEGNQQQARIDENGSYTTKEDVALYIHTYGKLPGNFITKKEAEKLGWTGGSLEPYAPGKCIGGSHFGNYEGLLPDGNYKECDIDTLGKKKRGAKRIIYSDDGRIYYTPDHYETFEQLY